MGLFSLFERNQRQADAMDTGRPREGAVPIDAPDVEVARTRARRRLIGAAVLVLVAVIAFPIVFETQPRPTSTAATIEVARSSEAPAKAVSGRAVTGVVTPAPRTNEIITESAAEAGREVTTSAPVNADKASQALVAPKEAAVKDTAAATATAKPAATTDAGKVPARPTAAASKAGAHDADRAQALLEGKTTVAKADAPKLDAPKADKPKNEAAVDAAGDAAGRFVVQVGAFADVNAAREARLRVEKLGLKTYTQVIETPGGKRIRVRVGPFGAKDEAERVVARIKSAGMSPAVLTL